MQHTINSFRRDTFSQVYQVYQVFQDFFGEANVDLQNLPSDDEIAGSFEHYHIEMREDGSCFESNGRQFNYAKNSYSGRRPFILVYWPRVTVTNENDKSIVIQDLYAKIELDWKGRIPTENMGFTLNRATYPMEQWVSNYMHSHISCIPKSGLTIFQLPCLGSGPIIGVINSLRDSIDDSFDEVRWMLFCQELSQYVTVESLRGIPYNKLEEVCLSKQLRDFTGFEENSSKMNYSLTKFYEVFNPEILKDFMLYYLQEGHLAINYQQGCFVPGMTYFDFMIDISNAFIDYFNSHFDSREIANRLFVREILYHAVVVGNKFYDTTGSRQAPDVSNYIGRKVCDFKGHEVKLNILSASEAEPQKSTVLNHGLAMYILNNILKIINYHYTNGYKQQIAGATVTTALPASAHQTVYYL